MVECLWAKKKDNGQYYWLPLIAHLTDTMEVAGWLWNHWLTEGQRTYCFGQIRGFTDINDCEKLVRFLAAVHDIGKATPAFQTQKNYYSGNDIENLLLDRLEKSGFDGISTLNLASPKRTHHSIAGEVILNRFGVKNDIASIIGGHHGKPIDDVEECENQINGYSANYYQTENKSELYTLWDYTQKSILTWALNESEIFSVENLPSLSEPCQVLLCGLLIMADWIASSEQFFPLIPISDLHVEDQDERFESGIEHWYKTLPITPIMPESAVQLYQSRFGFQPRLFQNKIFDHIAKIKEPGIIIIEVPTGMGKTEAALTSAEVLAAKTDRSGLFFGLPTQATSNGMFSRVLKWLDNVSQTYGTSSVRLVHGKSSLNEDMQRLEASQIDVDQGNDGSVIVNEWFSGRKKSMLDDFVVGTVDHFLLTALKQKHLALRHLGFSKKVVIIDEVHAYDAYMQQYLTEALRWMGAYNVPVILLSATLPKEIRKNLVKAYMHGRGINRDRDIIGLTQVSECEAYPLLTVSDGDEIKMFTDFEKEQSRTITVKDLTDEELYDQISKLVEQGGVIGIIVNTVRRAQLIAEFCVNKFGQSMVELLHSNFIAADRILKENNLVDMIGKNGKRPDKKIIIGTQVLEQSLDIDFDVLITDLCPIDLLIQRVGRLQRHDIKRPAHLSNPIVYVVGKNKMLDFEKGAKSIYGGWVLARTQYFLPDIIHIPEDVSSLVQRVYEESHIHLEGELEEKYEEYKEEQIGKIEVEREQAEAFKIDNPKMKIADQNNLIGWLKDPGNSLNEEMATAQVRGIQETIEIIAVKRHGEGYSFFHSNEDISKRIHDQAIQKKLASQTLRLPHSIIYGFGTSKIIKGLEDYNRKYLSEWQQEPWLKGSLGMIFDENGHVQVGNSILEYDNFYGLRRCREDGTV